MSLTSILATSHSGGVPDAKVLLQRLRVGLKAGRVFEREALNDR